MPETKTVRIHTSIVPRMAQVRSPGETDAELIDRAINLLGEIKDISSRFSESKEYKEWLAKRRAERGDVRD